MRVRDAVGLIVVGDTQIEVRPKIPQAHLLYLLEKAGYVPRLGDERALAANDTPLWRLVAQWFLTEAEKVLRRDLMRGYQNKADNLRLIRGRLDPVATSRAYYAGRLEFACEFDEFTTDIPLNRVLRAATRVVAGSSLLEWPDRRRALAVLARMDEVGDLQPGDLRTQVGRTTAHYRDALALGRHILQGHGRLIRTGDQAAWTFLLRTPEAVEAGVLATLQEHLGPRWSVAKQGKKVVGASMTLNPDLVPVRAHHP